MSCEAAGHVQRVRDLWHDQRLGLRCRRDDGAAGHRARAGAFRAAQHFDQWTGGRFQRLRSATPDRAARPFQSDLSVRRYALVAARPAFHEDGRGHRNYAISLSINRAIRAAASDLTAHIPAARLPISSLAMSKPAASTRSSLTPTCGTGGIRFSSTTILRRVRT